ncbi:methylmalonyl-CoA mutase family protein [Nitratireductor rhodophyticola]|uniref:methylmalonyl-CoA mutase family protein n=1 Tax=Nitratireductor rhodophyticola TaxID=2854036 RepID=UPI002AC9019E|nr:methylmalonyl-CoA mutase family protein [Nitratireductor rhodophyticola]WPZ14181.1 methylmalonyl-CoA mutase family protein [Nitratireductor rhodophyticola]
MMDRAILKKVKFPQIDQERWRDLVIESLKGEAGPEALSWQTDDNISMRALYERMQDAKPLARGRDKSGWATVQRMDDPDPVRANRQAKEDIAQGATGLALVFEGAPNAFGYGLPATPEAVAKALEGIDLQGLHLRMDANPSSRAIVDWLTQIFTERRINPAAMTLSFGISPAATFAGTGKLRMSIEALEASMPQSFAGFFAMDLPGILLEGDGRVFHNAGASEAQELGIMLASAVSHLRMFEQARQPLVYAAPHIGFSLCVDQDQFLSIAKIRALRRLWARVQETCSIEPSLATIHAETSYRMMTAKDPETNTLRTTIAAFAAAVGGADSLSVLPHTIVHGLPDEDARRLARNTQLILSGESHLDLIIDPAAGAGGMETLTAALCEKAWDEFRRIESEGGVLRSLMNGQIQERVLEMRERREQRINDGKKPIVGTTIYPAAEERPVKTLDAQSPDFSGETAAVRCQPLLAQRLDETGGGIA